MILERQNTPPRSSPTPAQIRRSLRTLKSYGKHTFASITAPDGSYLQVAGGGVACMLERRDADGARWRAFLDEPTSPFEDGTELTFGGGRIALMRDEWLRIEAVTQAFVAFSEGLALPAELLWRPSAIERS